MAFGTSSSETVVFPLNTVEAMTQMRALDKVTKEYGATATKAFADITKLQLALAKASGDDAAAITGAIAKKQEDYNKEIEKIKEVLATKDKLVAKTNAETDAANKLLQAERERVAFAMAPSGLQRLNEGDNVQERGTAGLKIMADKADMKQREAFLTNLLDQEEKKLDATDKQRIATMELEARAVGGVVSQEAQWRYELAEVSRQIEANRKKIADLATTDVGTSQQRKQAALVLHEEQTKLGKRQVELTRNVESGTGGILKNRDAMRQMAYAVQDFVSGGGMQNLAMGLRGSTNNFEMMAMSMGKTLTPLQLMGVSLIPTVALASIEMAMGLKSSASATDKAAEAMGKYEEYVKRTRDEVVDLTTKENQRELNRARREAGLAAGEGTQAEKGAFENLRDIEHKMNVYSGKEQPKGFGDRLASGWFAATAIARRAANNAGEIGGGIVGGLGGNRGPLWRVDTANDQLADAELKVRAVREKQAEGAKAAADKDRLLVVRRDVKDEVDRRNKELEARGEARHAIEKQRDDAIADRHGRPLRKRDARDFEMRLKESEDETNRLRDQLKRLEIGSRENPAMPLNELIQAINANTVAHGGGNAAPPARLPNLGNVQMFFNPMGN